MEGDKVVSYSISFRRISSQCVWLSQKAVPVEIKSTPDLCIYFQNFVFCFSLVAFLFSFFFGRVLEHLFDIVSK